MGLRLKLCRRFIAVNHGMMNIDSEVGKGTTISITLPAANQTNAV